MLIELAVAVPVCRFCRFGPTFATWTFAPGSPCEMSQRRGMFRINNVSTSGREAQSRSALAEVIEEMVVIWVRLEYQSNT